ncbi:ORF6N domain-containing protein [Sphingobacterium nematocida]|nr:ORF6N domain-containing protein [Sphingobacterium nematocida]
MLYSDLAELYGVETRRLKEQVRRKISFDFLNISCFNLQKTEDE